jgi:hypothetical protein
MDWIRKSVLTEKIAEADREVDRVLVGINSIVDSGRHSSTPAIKDAAERLYTMLKNYGRVSSESYDDEAGDVRELLKQFYGPYASDVANLGLSMWVDELQSEFNIFESLLRRRADERIQKPPYTAREVRKGLEDVYRRIAYRINANAEVGMSPEFAAFIDSLNPEIERLNVEFHRAKKDLGAGDHTVIEPIPTQTYTEQPITPIPTVYYREDATKPVEKLSLGKDFEVTYKNNVKVGMAELTVHGKGRYTGQATVKFNIARKPTPTEES